jgi:hypothetical protein
MKYLLLVCWDAERMNGQTEPDPSTARAEDEEGFPWVDDLHARGIWLTGDQLAPPRRARSVRVRGGKKMVPDGPFTETKEAVGGCNLLCAIALAPCQASDPARAAARQRACSDTTNGVLRRLGRRVERLSQQVAEVERNLVTELAPDLLAEAGVGPVCAAQLLVSSGDSNRMASEASFAALAGTSPIDSSSGEQQRHRVNRGGDRQLNWALHVIALARIRHHAETATYYERLLATDKTTREARRCVKRALARHFYRRLRELSTIALTT